MILTLLKILRIGPDMLYDQVSLLNINRNFQKKLIEIF